MAAEGKTQMLQRHCAHVADVDNITLCDQRVQRNAEVRVDLH